VRLRDAAEQALRAWDAHETSRGAPPVIDYDCAPGTNTRRLVAAVLAVA
jgi:hypothetical protein